MESANFHQQQHQEHEPVLDSSCYGLSWSQNTSLNNTSNNTNSRENIHLVPCHNAGPPVLGLPWNTTASSNVTSNPIENFMTHELQRLARIKDEFSASESYPRFSEMINSSPTSSVEDLHLNPSPGYDNNQEFLLRTFSNECQIKGSQVMHQVPDDTQNNLYQNCSRGTFSQIFPTINVSHLNQSPTAATVSSNSFDMNLPALDLFGSPRFTGNLSHPSSFNPHQLGSFFKDTCLSYGLDQMHQSNHRPAIFPSKISSAFNTRTSCTEAKRPATNYMDTKAPQATVPKKSKVEPRASCAPFKVRKEKLGDRIAALQQMVAPFGKTDTASVLMEAIGYIKFLQNQVEEFGVDPQAAVDREMQHVMGTNQTRERVHRGAGTNQAGDRFAYHGFEHRMRKLKMPVFEGEDAYGWIYKVERYFEIQGLLQHEQLRAAALCMEGEALSWYRWSEGRTPFHSWDGFKRLLMIRFQQSQEGILYEQFLAITQEESAQAYVALFEKLACQLVGILESVMEATFIKGLKPALREAVRVTNPEGLNNVMELAVSIEYN